MSKYTLEVQINTAQSILTLVDGKASEFQVKDLAFKSSRLDFDQRAGYRYYISTEIEASHMFEAYDLFTKKIAVVTDSIAYFYSQPVTVEYWNLLIKKEGDDAAYLSAYRLMPATAMTDYSAIAPELLEIIEKAENSEELQNTLWIYNNIAKIDGVDYDPASHQFGLCQLIESLANKDTVQACEACGRGEYTRTSRKDMKSILGDDLYKKLYGGSDILRNRLGHGNLVGGKFLPNQEVEDVILKATTRITEKYGVKNKVSEGMVDRIRSTNRWYGAAYGIEHKDMCLEECLSIHIDEQQDHDKKPIPKGW
ncbi:MAG TPA: hypothetical protein VIM53_03135 [Candidatus Saccharimonadales bacterium]